MKIGIVTTWFERGAAYVSKQYEMLLEDKHDVFIYARGEQYAIGDPQWDKKNVHWGKRYAIPEPKYIDKTDFIKWLTDHAIECVLFNEQTWYSSVIICKELGIKTGAYIDYYTEETLPLFTAYDFLICNTKRHYAAFSGHHHCNYVPWGTDIDLFKPSPRLKENDTIIFFHSAGMNPFRKGTDFLIQAFYTLTLLHQDIKLIIHTQVSIDIYFPDLKEMIATLVHSQHLEIIDKTITAPGLYYKSDIYVYPSRIEGIGLTIAEALSSGLPVITSDNQPMNEFIEAPSQVVTIKKMYCRQDAYYWPMCEVDIDDLMQKMEYFIINKAQLDTYKKETRAYAEEKLSWINNKESINHIFENASIVPLSEALTHKLKKHDNRRFFFITEVPKLYSFFYSIYKKFH